MSNADALYTVGDYEVVQTDDAVGEDGKMGRNGYAVFNVKTQVVEATTTILPQAIYQAQGFSDSLTALMAPEEKAPSRPSLVDFQTGEDVVPN